MNTSKPIYKSKTFWVQILTILSALIPPVGKWVAENPVDFVVALAAVNTLVRFATSGKVTVFSDDAASGGNGGPLLVVMAAGLLAMGALPSCSAVGAAITGAPIPATAVQRTGGGDSPPVLVASADLAGAEAAALQAERLGEPPPVHGLYDAGRAAATLREVFTESSK